MVNKAEKISRIFKVLSNPLRLKILALCLTKERTVRELCKILKVSKPLLISHLKKLIEVGLIEYKTEIDPEKLIIRKYYRTPKGILIKLDERILLSIAEECERGEG